jgi:hypothetical protein
MKNEEKIRKGRIRIVDKLFTKENLKKFCKEHNRLPTNVGPTVEERRLYQFFKYHRGEPDIEELRDKFKQRNTPDESFLSILDFCEKHGRMPYYSKRRKEEMNLYMIWYNHRKEPKYIELKNKYGSSVESQVVSFCEEYGRLPKFSDKDLYENRLRNYWNKNMKNNPEFLEFNKKYYHPTGTGGKIEIKIYTFEELEEFCMKNNRLPRKKGECGLHKFLHKHKDESKFKELYEKYRRFSKKIEKEMKNVIIPEPEPTECSKESYVERITKLTKEFLEAWGSEATIDTLETLLKDVNKEKRNALITLYGKLGVS